MTAGLVLVTHAGIATAVLARASEIQGFNQADVQVIEVKHGAKTRQPVLQEAVDRADQGHGVLIMTDLPGATPANLARKVEHEPMRVISGLNLPMLIRAWTYRNRPLDELTQRALEGGQMAIMEIQ